MAQALHLAERGQYSAHPNPMVACIIVNDGAERAIAELVAIIRREEARPVPFLTDQPAAPKAAPAEELVETLTGKLGPALRAEMVTLIGDHLKAVLDRDLGSLMLETLQERRKGR